MLFIKLKVLSYNIHKGFSFRNRRFTLNEIKRCIQQADADLVLLQEVQGESKAKSKLHQDWPKTSHFEHLADSIWDHYAYGKNAVYPDGHHGNAILSKFPITHWENFDISTNKVEKRGLLHATIKIPEIDRQLHCLCLHLNLLHSGRRLQIEKISRLLSKSVPKDSCLVIGGDFNDWSANLTKQFESDFNLKEAFKCTHKSFPRTFPSNFPLFKLDRIYFRGAQVISATVLREWKTISDHLALLAEFKVI